jgi:hypothetical protein
MEMNIIATIDRAIYPAGTTLNCKENGFIFEVSPRRVISKEVQSCQLIVNW